MAYIDWQSVVLSLRPFSGRPRTVGRSRATRASRRLRHRPSGNLQVSERCPAGVTAERPSGTGTRTFLTRPDLAPTGSQVPGSARGTPVLGPGRAAPAPARATLNGGGPRALVSGRGHPTQRERERETGSSFLPLLRFRWLFPFPCREAWS